jgi:hypothetical protein
MSIVAEYDSVLITGSLFAKLKAHGWRQQVCASCVMSFLEELYQIPSIGGNKRQNSCNVIKHVKSFLNSRSPPKRLCALRHLRHCNVLQISVRHTILHTWGETLKKQMIYFGRTHWLIDSRDRNDFGGEFRHWHLSRRHRDVCWKEVGITSTTRPPPPGLITKLAKCWQQSPNKSPSLDTTLI